MFDLTFFFKSLIVPISKDFEAIRSPFSKTEISVLPPPTSTTMKGLDFSKSSNINVPKINLASSSPDMISISTPVFSWIKSRTSNPFIASLIAEVAQALRCFTS